MSASAWDVERYEGGYSFVWQHGASLVELLAPQAGEKVLDAGCGTGHLTAQIAKSGAEVLGVDNSPEMLGQARQNYPALRFAHAEAGVVSIARVLRPGGRFVAEFGGKGNIATIMDALRVVLGNQAEERCPWRFMGIGEYASLLDRHGLEVRQASLFDRPTRMEGEHGFEDWMRMFGGSFFREKPEPFVRQKIREIIELLRPSCYRDGAWILDYRRLRIMAVASGS